MSESDASPRSAIEAGAAPEQPFDCQSCGACCYVNEAMLKTTRKDYVYVLQSDVLTHHRHRNLVRQVATYAGGRKWVLNVTQDAEPRCQQLRGELGNDVSCGIYEFRPKMCRWFTAGTESCVKARRFKGLPVPEDFVPLKEDPWSI